MANISSVLSQLKQERARLASQLNSLNNAISALNVRGSARRGRISAAGRAWIAAAQRARSAKVKGKVVSITASKKRKLSAAAVSHIRAAQKARWAKWAEGKEKG